LLLASGDSAPGDAARSETRRRVGVGGGGRYHIVPRLKSGDFLGRRFGDFLEFRLTNLSVLTSEKLGDACLAVRLWHEVHTQNTNIVQSKSDASQALRLFDTFSTNQTGYTFMRPYCPRYHPHTAATPTECDAMGWGTA